MSGVRVPPVKRNARRVHVPSRRITCTAAMNVLHLRTSVLLKFTLPSDCGANGPTGAPAVRRAVAAHIRFRKGTTIAAGETPPQSDRFGSLWYRTVPVHCDVSAWSTWTTCTLTCGGGAQTRSRSVVTHAEHGGYVCPSLEEVQQCNDSPCPVDCTTTEWTGWSTCTATCGGGTHRRSRSVTTPVQHGGTAC